MKRKILPRVISSGPCDAIYMYIYSITGYMAIVGKLHMFNSQTAFAIAFKTPASDPTQQDLCAFVVCQLGGDSCAVAALLGLAALLLFYNWRTIDDMLV